MPPMTSKDSKRSRQTKQSTGNQAACQAEAGSHEQMHQEHVQWMSDIATWRDDIVEWEGETRNTLKELKQLETMLQQHDLALVAHSEDLVTHRRKMVSHEHSLSEFEQEGAGDNLIGAAHDHCLEREKHVSQQTLHEAIKHRHRGLIAHWQELRKKISQLPPV